MIFYFCSWLHLLFNLLVQVLVGLPLEMVHGSLRIGAVYMAGVLAGSLGTSVFDTDVYLVGASGGVYALLAAHLANVLLNYSNMEFGIVRLIGIFVVGQYKKSWKKFDQIKFGVSNSKYNLLSQVFGLFLILSLIWKYLAFFSL